MYISNMFVKPFAHVVFLNSALTFLTQLSLPQKGVLFAIKRCDLLASRRMCIGLVRMPTPAGRNFLRRMSLGLPPPGYSGWPDEGADVGLRVRTWLGRGIWVDEGVGPHV